MARHKDFGSEGVYRPEELEPISFALLGETFNCKPILPGATLVEIISAIDGSTGSGGDAVTETFRAALTPADVDRFYALLKDEDYVVSLQTLVDILQWLVEQYGQRPTLRSGSSSDGASTTGPGSEGGTSSTQVTPLPVEV
jgi:hypothetical protein